MSAYPVQIGGRWVPRAAAPGRIGVEEARAHRAATHASKRGAEKGGLVPSSTSHSASASVFDALMPGEVEVDADAARVQRLRQRVLTASRLQDEELRGQRVYPVMVTLTYADGADWSARHISVYLNAVRLWWRRFAKRPLRYVWVAELQQRGAVHYHAIFWMPAGFTLPKADKRGWWPHGSTRTEAARKPVAYLCKYASKVEHAFGFPKGCRLFGVGGLQETISTYRWWALPSWARQQFGVACDAVRSVGGGVESRARRLSLPSPWRVSFSRGRTLIRRVFSHLGDVGNVCGPFSLLEFS